MEGIKAEGGVETGKSPFELGKQSLGEEAAEAKGDSQGEEVVGAEGDSEGEDTLDDYVEDLSFCLRNIRTTVFDNQDQPEEEVYERGFSGLAVELHPRTRKPYLKIASGSHDGLTRYYTTLLNNDYHPSWGVAVDGSVNVFMGRNASRKRRKPDIAFWGPGKCHSPQRILEPMLLVLPPKIFRVSREQHEPVNPDVVVQISWGNSEPYEFDAINDLMNHALVRYPHAQPSNQAPRLGCLIKIRLSNKRTRDDQKIIRSIDFFRLSQGRTVDDAKASRNATQPAGQRILLVEEMLQWP